ncbi:hypothetical protein AD943_10850 [Gluconobacter roseus]|nr:hypothetical protein AD943_10850 [Gluconobacter roseus]
MTDTGETSRQAGAEGATAPETLRPKDRGGQDILERGALDASADGIAISGERTEGATSFRPVFAGSRSRLHLHVFR